MDFPAALLWGAVVRRSGFDTPTKDTLERGGRPRSGRWKGKTLPGFSPPNFVIGEEKFFETKIRDMLRQKSQVIKNVSAQRGFSLLEVVVSLFIIAVMLALYQVSLDSITLSRSAKDQDIALRVAGGKMEELRALGYASLPASGPFTDPQLSLLPGSSASLAVSDFNPKTKQATVTVSWLEPGSSPGRSVSLTTLITKLGGLQ
jgi:prepilin-type N-terminal cleavage/methylation domain-containing protein